MDLIIGAGVSGLSYANFTKNEYLIIEKEKVPGGYCKTTKRNGFTWDYSGHFFHFRNKILEEFLVQRMRNKNRILQNIKKETQIYYKNKLIDFPFQKNIHQLEKDEFIDCIYDLFFREQKETYNSFKEMVYGTYGKSIAEKFLIPYNEKLYSCDLDKLDQNAMGRFFPYADITDIIANFKGNDNNSYNSSFTYHKDGAIEYVKALLKDLDETKISYNEKLLKVDLHNKMAITNKRKIQYENLINTIPLPDYFDLAGIDYNKNIYNWNKVLVFNFGFDKKGREKTNHWIYFPEKIFPFYRVGFYDNILNQSKMSLYIEVSFYKNGKIDIYKTREKVIEGLKAANIITNETIIDEENIIMDPAYVHVNYSSNLDKNNKMQILNDFQTFSIGRYGDWKYCSIEDNILEAYTLADNSNSLKEKLW